ncbi:MAG: bifunctional oligoribonuclease/PAP phosphatase NrnA [Erysipelotrichaceae bacterium]|nr:bifunctional oligoribonuclease/PAP phosphatase NrnA [Erysipelotrichaceae bacterium]
MHNFEIFKQLLAAIEAAPIITLFRHVNPDPDAYGSQLALKEWIQYAYPNKQVYALGEGERSSEMDEVDDQTIANSLAIVTDTANRERIDDQRYTLAKQIARIDHHLRVDDFGDLDLVEVSASATCEIQALMFKQAGLTIGQKAAQELLQGLMADSQRFTITTVRAQSFEAAAWLMEQQANPQQAAKFLFSRDYSTFEISALIANQAVKRGAFLFSVLSQKDYLSRGVSFETAKSQVNALNNIKGIMIWALFTQQPDGLYSASLRSAKVAINELANQYGGGGHQQACGIKNLDVRQLTSLIEQLEQLAQSEM